MLSNNESCQVLAFYHRDIERSSKMTKVYLSEKANEILRSNGFTWSGAKKSSELVKQRMFEKKWIINNGKPKRPHNGIIVTK